MCKWKNQIKYNVKLVLQRKCSEGTVLPKGYIVDKDLTIIYG